MWTSQICWRQREQDGAGGRGTGTAGTERLIQIRQDRVGKKHRKQNREWDPGRVAGRDWLKKSSRVCRAERASERESKSTGVRIHVVSVHTAASAWPGGHTCSGECEERTHGQAAEHKSMWQRERQKQREAETGNTKWKLNHPKPT